MPPPPDAPLTLDRAARLALAWHPSVVQAASEIGVQEQAIAEARADYLPRISAGVGTGYDNRLSDSWRPRPQLGASQMLFDFGKVRSAVDAARSGRDVERAELLLAIDTLVRETGYAVIETQRAVALHAVAQDQLASVAAIGKLVRDRYEAGGTTESDALQAQARIDAARVALIQIEAEQRRWSSNLAYLLGRDSLPAVSPETPDWLAGSCTGPAPDWATVPAIMAADAREDFASAQLRRSRADRLPTLSLGGDASTDFASPFGDRSLYNVGLRISGNVFSGGATRARVRGADAALAAARAGVKRARLDSRQRLAEARQQIDSLSGLTGMLSARETAMRNTGRLYKLQYLEMGTRTLVDLLNAEQELHGTRFEAVNTEHDLRRLQLDCLFHSGRIRQAFGLAGTRIGGVVL
ncbi:transporter [Sphingomonas turrisvirgatae]|uniref:Transporter n=2 Tax=Sphingomonas turrisvirgatae TaxID=1888892 RepID=A0A1E3LWJ8_9SPHN|nr:transporter [Sphingomonas turrisvirgatae]